MRRKSLRSLISCLAPCLAVALALVTAVGLEERGRLRDAWALLTEYGGGCEESSTEACRALTAEVVGIVEELAPMSEDERGARADRYAARLSSAVSERLANADGSAPSAPEAPVELSKVAEPAFSQAPAALPVPETTVTTVPTTPAPDISTKPNSEGSPAHAAEAGPPRIVIRSVSGEPWRQIRERRRRERTAQMARFRPRVERELATLRARRQELAEAVAVDSLEGASESCLRLGAAAQKADRAILGDAPDRSLAFALEHALRAYEAAGRGCSNGRYVEAFVALSSGDRAWRRLAGAIAPSPRTERVARRSGASARP